MQGPLWLPGVVVAREGSAIYRVKLDDGWVIRRHGEQLRHRQDTGDLRRTSENATLETELNPTAKGDSLLDAAEHSDPSPGPPAPTGTAESEPPLESHEEPSNSVSIKLQPIKSQLIESQTTESQPNDLELDESTQLSAISALSADGTQQLRRSSWVHNPPLRYDSNVYNV